MFTVVNNNNNDSHYYTYIKYTCMVSPITYKCTFINLHIKGIFNIILLQYALVNIPGSYW